MQLPLYSSINKYEPDLELADNEKIDIVAKRIPAKSTPAFRGAGKIIKLSKDNVLLLHKLIAEEAGGSISPRDEALLDSAPEAAFPGFGDKTVSPFRPQKLL